MRNIVNSTDKNVQRLIDRLNAVLMVTKSCSGTTCTTPWQVLQPANITNAKPIGTLKDALDPAYDEYFATFPKVQFKVCMQYQDADNEAPFYPPESRSLGTKWRKRTDFYGARPIGGTRDIPTPDYETKLYGTWAQRNATLKDIMKVARKLNDIELGYVHPSTTTSTSASSTASSSTSTSRSATLTSNSPVTTSPASISPTSATSAESVTQSVDTNTEHITVTANS